MSKRALRIGQNLSIPLEAVTETFSILAKRGAGKTHTSVVMTEEMLCAGLQVVVCDPVGVWWGLRSSKDGTAKGFSIPIFGGEHADVPLDERAGKLVADTIMKERISAVLDLSLFSKGQTTHFMIDFAERLYRKNRQPLHLVLDEADAFAPQNPRSGGKGGGNPARMLGAVEDLVRRGRARGLGITLISQRSAVLNKDVLTQTEVLIALRTTSPQDRKAVDEWVKAHGTDAEREAFMAGIASLPTGTAWFWSPSWLNIFKQVKVRDRQTFDSSATPRAGKSVKPPREFSSVDIEQLREHMASLVQEAQENDPKRLKAEVARLMHELKTAQRQGGISNADVHDRLEKAYREGYSKGLIEGADRLRGAICHHVDTIQGAAKKVGDMLVAATTGKATEQTPTQKPAPARKSLKFRDITNRHFHKTPHTSAGSPDLGKGERATLIAVAQHSAGVTRNQLTILTGYKRSTRDAYLQRLRGRGLIDQDGATITATPEGLQALGSDFEPLPTGAALLEYWRENLPEGERRVLDVTVAAYPGAVRRETVDDEIGYKRSSRDAYIQRLASRKLVKVTGPGEITAAELLFE